MQQETFARRDVVRAFRKFIDIQHDLLGANANTWHHHLKHMIDHCENNPVMSTVIAPLRENNHVNLESWFNELTGANFRRAKYSLPLDDIERASLIYQLLSNIAHAPRGDRTVVGFSMRVFGSSNDISELISNFDNEITSKFTREIVYRLNEIQEDLGESTVVKKEEIVVFQNFGNYQNINGNINNNNVAIGSSSISTTSENISQIDEIRRLLKNLEEEVIKSNGSLTEQHTDSIRTMDLALSNENVSPSEVSHAVEKLASLSNASKSILKDISLRTVATLGANKLSGAIDFVLSSIG